MGGGAPGVVVVEGVEACQVQFVVDDVGEGMFETARQDSVYLF
jgi:hypothetical protein